MKMQIKEFAKFTGVSVRTLHYYDELGLLKPAFVDKSSGYRFYDEKSLLRMQEVLFFRELDFPLKEIKEILSSTDYDMEKVLCEQKRLLVLKKERLEKIILAVEGAMKGENVMKSFDNSEFEKYKDEAKEKWGGSAAYKEFEEKNAGRSEEEISVLGEGMTDIFRRMGEIKDSSPKSEEAQKLVEKLKNFICDNYYTCTDEILFSLGQMYVADERFLKNIDNAGGEGTADFAAKAITAFCGK